VKLVEILYFEKLVKINIRRIWNWLK